MANGWNWDVSANYGKSQSDEKFTNAIVVCSKLRQYSLLAHLLDGRGSSVSLGIVRECHGRHRDEGRQQAGSDGRQFHWG